MPHDPETGEALVRQTPQQIVDRILALPEGHPLPGAGTGGAGPQGHLRAALRRPRRPRASPGSASTARCTTCPSSSTWPATSCTTSRWSSTGSSCATASSVGSPTRWRPRCDLAEGVAQIEIVPPKDAGGRRGRAPHLLREPVASLRRQELRGAGAEELLVQLALRRVPGVRRARHDLRGRSRAGGPRSRPLGVRRGARPVGLGARQVLPPAARVGVRERRHRRRHAVRVLAEEAAQRSCSTGSADGDKVNVRFRNRYGRTRTYTARYEGVIPYLQAAPQRVRERLRP